MPVVHFHLAEGRFTDAQADTLLVRASVAYADALDTPAERVRAFIAPYRPQLCAVGGSRVSERFAGIAYFTAAVLTGRPATQRHRVLADLTDLLVEVLDVPRDEVRGRIVQVDSEDWGIGGLPASVVRADEVAVRSGEH